MKWAILLLIPLAGCVAEGPEEPTHRVSGTFTTEWSSSQQDREHFDALVQKYDGEAVIMESFPEQFAVTLGETNCYLLVQELEDQPYVGNVGACSPV